jgi:hypothetical protein
MVNKWVEFIKKYALDNNINYKKAMMSSDCKDEYKKLQNTNKCIEARKFTQSDGCKGIYIDKEDRYDDFLLKDIKKKRQQRNDDLKLMLLNKKDEPEVININKKEPKIKITSKLNLVKFEKQRLAKEQKLIKEEQKLKASKKPYNNMIGSGYKDVLKKVKGSGIIGDIAGSLGGIGATMLTANPIGTMVGSYAGNKLGNKMDEILGTGMCCNNISKKEKKPKILVISGGSLYPG